MVRVRRFRPDAYAVLRKRMIRETETALAIGFRFPDRVRRIPTVEVGYGTFAPDFAARFWQAALELDDDEMSAIQHTPGEQDRVMEVPDSRLVGL